MTNEFNAAAAAVLASLAPLWFVLLADIRTREPRRVVLLVAMLTASAAATVGAGGGMGLLYSKDDPALRAALVQYFTGLIISTTVLTAAWTPIRRRRLIREQWRAEHPDADLAPTTRWQRRAAAELDELRTWHARAHASLQATLDSRGWVTTSVTRTSFADRPKLAALERPSKRHTRFLDSQSESTRSMLFHWREGLAPLQNSLNDEHLAAVEHEDRPFFDSIERSPLTDEQRRAVICLDDRVRLVAAAGSGKTSTLVAKAAYAVRAGLVEPERMLVLAFNDAAAREANVRLRKVLGSFDGHVRASTFHAFGLSVVGTARGRKPALARAIEQTRVRDQLAVFVRDLRATDERFRSDWDLFRNVFFDRSDEAAPMEIDGDRPLSRSGVLVRSAGECMIADWLWYHGVEFEYERAFAVDTVDADHRQYAPDFYYPGADLWHEHFALDRFGAAPAHFENYAESITWKRGLHAAAGTDLFETTTAETDDGSALDRLATRLRQAGIELVADPNRPARGRPVIPEGRLLELVEKMLQRVRTMDAAQVDAIAASGSARTRLLLRLVESIRGRWESMLDQEEAIDYEGMVIEAARAFENGLVEPQFDLILVDEFQDMSADRARLVRALLDRPGARLFAVGDDWQAINGFAGSDLEEMVGFEERWGAGTTLRLERTFRSSQPICDVAGTFVARNPSQLRKSVRSGSPIVERPVLVQAVSAAGQTAAAAAWLTDLQQKMSDARRRGSPLQQRSVLLLGRYRSTEELAPRTTGLPDLRCTFSTIHGAKGLEADYVVLLDVVSGTQGFPSTKVDDPALRSLLPAREQFPHSEERRLLYVALTRARRAVLVLTDGAKPSPFVLELVAEDGVAFINGQGAPAQLCPACKSAVLVQRDGRYGAFEACGSRTSCSFSRSIGPDARAAALARR